jgi:uncharacterized protein HemY
MTSQFLAWWLLSAITGSPVGSLVFLVVLWWLGDRFTFRVFPDPFRWWGRRSRMRRLETGLLQNPHDRRARLELAGLQLDAGQPGRAARTLMPNVEAGDDDAVTAFTLGAAFARSGEAERAERVLAKAREIDPAFRLGEIDLELGRLRLARKDHPGARAALEALVAMRPGTVQGRVLLARALRGLGDAGGAGRALDEAWREYLALPRFHRRVERRWAWQARPLRPVAYAAIALAVLVLLAGALGSVAPTSVGPGSARPPAYAPEE